MAKKHAVEFNLSIGFAGENRHLETTLEELLGMSFEEIEAIDEDELDKLISDELDEWSYNYIDLYSGVEIVED